MIDNDGFIIFLDTQGTKSKYSNKGEKIRMSEVSWKHSKIFAIYYDQSVLIWSLINGGSSTNIEHAAYIHSISTNGIY